MKPPHSFLIENQGMPVNVSVGFSVTPLSLSSYWVITHRMRDRSCREQVDARATAVAQSASRVSRGLLRIWATRASGHCSFWPRCGLCVLVLAQDPSASEVHPTV